MSIEYMFHFGKGNTVVLSVSDQQMTVLDLLMTFSSVTSVAPEDILYVIINGKLVSTDEFCQLDTYLHRFVDKHTAKARGGRISVHVVTKQKDDEHADEFDQIFNHRLIDAFDAVDKMTSRENSAIRQAPVNNIEFGLGLGLVNGTAPPGLQDMIAGMFTTMLGDAQGMNQITQILADSYEDLSRLQSVRVGIDDALFAHLTRTVLLSDLSDDVRTNECFCGMILNETHPDEPSHILTQLPCSHVFHHCCIRHHLEESVKCPICNADVRDVPPPTAARPPYSDTMDSLD